MTYVLYILIGILLVYLFFSFFPSFFMFRSVFFRRWNKEGKEPKRKEYYLPFLSLLEPAESLLRSLPCRTLSLSSRDGVTLRADYYHQNADKTAILLHGYRASPLSNCAYTAALLWEHGYNILMPYQRAHGQSDGRFCSMGLYEQYDLLSWIAHAAADETVTAIAVCGMSMGSASVAFASDKIKEPKVKALVLDCGFTSVKNQLTSDCKKWGVPLFLVMPVVSLGYRLRFGGDIAASTESSLKNCRIPSLFIHGTGDTSVTLDQGEAGFAACSAEKQALTVPDAAHTCALLQGGRPAADCLLSFLDRYIPTEHNRT